ncbi:MAG: dephospho-CoA kinase [Planctomycetota bacterium]
MSSSTTVTGSGASKPASRASLVIGVIGGIASGKSAVARMLAGPAGRVIDADEIAREVLVSPAVRFDLLCAFGGGVFDRQGNPDREAIAKHVFGSAEKRRKLEAFTHPAIRARIRAALEAARRAGVRRIVLDVPLLLENDASHGLAAECDEIVFVDSDEAERDARAVASRGWRPGDVARREATQMPLAEKRARASRIVTNRGSLADLERVVGEIAPE